MHNRYGILFEIYVVGTWEFANSFKSIWVGLDKIIFGVDLLFDFFPFLTYFDGLTMLPELNRAVEVNNPQPATGRLS